MKHLSDIEWIEAVARRLPADAQARVEAHLADCPDCRERFAETSRTWDLLGDWHVSAEGRDVRGAVAAALQRERTIPLSAWRRWGRTAVAAAAAVLLAAGIGHVAGRLVAGRTPASPPGRASVQVTQDAVAEAFALDALAGARSVGLADVLLANHTGPEPEESS